MLPEAPCHVEWHKAADPRRFWGNHYGQLFRQAAGEIASFLKKEEGYIYPVIVKVMQEVEQAFLDSSRTQQIVLEKGYSFFHAPPLSIDVPVCIVGFQPGESGKVRCKLRAKLAQSIDQVIRI